jgi:hypothetical protein
VAGGNQNSAGGGYAATVGGGQINQAIGNAATVGGGENNLAKGDHPMVGGGFHNTANGTQATVGGGYQNQATNSYATVPGGINNTAGGVYSFAAGYNAYATNNGAFVWSDGSAALTKSFTNNQFMARASGGVIFLSGTAATPTSYATGTAGVALLPGANAWSTVSDRNAKKNFTRVDGESILEKLAAIPIEQWNYKWEKDSDTPNIGPMAQDFKSAFYPGRDDKSISTLEFDGVALAAIQGLNQKVEEKEARIQNQAAEIAELKARLDRLEQAISGK